MSTSDQPTDALAQQLNLETAQMPWQELLRFFANGTVIVVHDSLDLPKVAACIAQDDVSQVSEWMQAQQLVKVNDAQASAWLEQDMLMWTVVVKPWILVQPARPGTSLH